MVKRCCHGICKSDSRYADREENPVTFWAFPKPKTNLERCKLWIKLCGRPHVRLNLEMLHDYSKAKHKYICSKHFKDGKPTKENPDPVPACKYDMVTPVRPPPKLWPATQPMTKRAKILCTETSFTMTADQISHLSENSAECSFKGPTHADPETQTVEPVKDPSGLDYLAMVAENKLLKEKLKTLTDEAHRGKMKAETKNAATMGFCVDSLKNSHVKDNFEYHTGFTFEEFQNIFDFLVPDKDESLMNFSKTISSAKNMSLQDQLLLVLTKLRLNFDFKHLATLFGISPQDAAALFREWIDFIFHKFRSVTIWPDRDVLYEHMPPNYKKDFPDPPLIIDGTVIKVEEPSSPRSQSQCYSDFDLVGVDPRVVYFYIHAVFGINVR